MATNWSKETTWAKGIWRKLEILFQMQMRIFEHNYWNCRLASKENFTIASWFREVQRSIISTPPFSPIPTRNTEIDLSERFGIPKDPLIMGVTWVRFPSPAPFRFNPQRQCYSRFSSLKKSGLTTKTYNISIVVHGSQTCHLLRMRSLGFLVEGSLTFL